MYVICKTVYFNTKIILYFCMDNLVFYQLELKKISKYFGGN